VVLNKELEHRVKNNLQIISSLIQMQERGAQPETLKRLQEIRIRIENIGILHTKLTINNEINNFPEYVNSIVNNILLILSYDKKVKTQLNINLEKVSSNISFPLGLILNEWITNSIKHAYIPNDILNIYVEINKVNDYIEVLYKDNGLEIDTTDCVKSIGTEIVEILCLQLDAKLIQENVQKFDYKLLIPLKSA
jgi:two-component sensor histidine kinase